MGAFWTRNAGRHARLDPPLVPQQCRAEPPPTVPVPALPAAPAPRHPVTLGPGALLRDGTAPAASPVFTGLRVNPGEPAAAVICLGGGYALDITRAQWLDDLLAAARRAREALARDAAEARLAAAIAGAGTGQPDPDGERP